MTSLKLYRAMIHSKSAYSRAFAVFTAWKMHVKESRLLSKYLAESTTQNAYHTVSYSSSRADPMTISRMRTVEQPYSGSQMTRQAEQIEWFKEDEY
jgi:hypothetical protein